MKSQNICPALLGTFSVEWRNYIDLVLKNDPHEQFKTDFSSENAFAELIDLQLEATKRIYATLEQANEDNFRKLVGIMAEDDRFAKIQNEQFKNPEGVFNFERVCSIFQNDSNFENEDGQMHNYPSPDKAYYDNRSPDQISCELLERKINPPKKMFFPNSKGFECQKDLNESFVDVNNDNNVDNSARFSNKGWAYQTLLGPEKKYGHLKLDLKDCNSMDLVVKKCLTPWKLILIRGLKQF